MWFHISGFWSLLSNVRIYIIHYLYQLFKCHSCQLQKNQTSWLIQQVILHLTYIRKQQGLNSRWGVQISLAKYGQGHGFSQLTTFYPNRVLRFHLFKAGFVTNLIWTFHDHILGCDDLPLPISLQPSICPH